MSRLGIGGNEPPIGDRLELDHADLMVEAGKALSYGPLDPITGAEGVAEYATVAKNLRTLAAKVEKARKAEKEPLLEAERTVDAFFKQIATPVIRAIDSLSATINVWQREELRRQREAQAEAARREAEAAKVFGEQAPPPPPPIAAKDAVRVVGTSGYVTATASTKWIYEVVDIDQVPRHFMQINDDAVNAAIAGGTRDIMGLRIFEDVVTIIRR